MRADRLLSILMLLQARGHMTASALAEELEVSTRTIYRDIDALSAAGVPVYAELGARGGYSVLESYRTTLTGLSEDEIRALFMLSIPSPLADLGVAGDLKAALLKLQSSLRDAPQRDETRFRQWIHLDATWWFQGREAVPHLRTLHQAVCEDRRIVMSYSPVVYRRAVLKREVEPYGLVAKAGVWHLVFSYETEMRVVRVADVAEVRLLEETFARAETFELRGYWETWCARYEQVRPAYHATIRVAPALVPLLPRDFGPEVREQALAAQPDAEGWRSLPLQFESLVQARGWLLGVGRAAEVLEPLALRLSVQDFARQIVRFYDERESTHDTNESNQGK